MPISDEERAAQHEEERTQEQFRDATGAPSILGQQYEEVAGVHLEENLDEIEELELAVIKAIRRVEPQRRSLAGAGVALVAADRPAARQAAPGNAATTARTL